MQHDASERDLPSANDNGSPSFTLESALRSPNETLRLCVTAELVPGLSIEMAFHFWTGIGWAVGTNPRESVAIQLA